jgi:hypothetical protein
VNEREFDQRDEVGAQFARVLPAPQQVRDEGDQEI